MQIIRGYRDLDRSVRGATVALGNLDGVHLGHRAVIEAARALDPNAPLGVATFDPHPRQHFQPDAPPFLLTPIEEKARKLAGLEVERMHVIGFDGELALMPPEAFAREVLAEGLGVAGVAVGRDFRFGAKRAGDADMLASLGADLGFATAILDDVADDDGAPLSSSAARQALREGKPEAAAAILGEAHRIAGTVEEGDRRGRTIGFPTANLSLDGILWPRFGVYAITAHLDDEALPGVANLGMRPTFDKDVPILEAHLLDVDRDLYGKRMGIALHSFIRPEQRFEGIDALRTQIAKDVQAARAFADAQLIGERL